MQITIRELVELANADRDDRGVGTLGRLLATNTPRAHAWKVRGCSEIADKALKDYSAAVQKLVKQYGDGAKTPQILPEHAEAFVAEQDAALAEVVEIPWEPLPESQLIEPRLSGADYGRLVPKWILAPKEGVGPG